VLRTLAQIETFVYPAALATTTDTMLITVNTHTYLVEAASAAPTSSCRQGFDRMPWSGENRALAGRCAR
jgi:hypothetical protein